METLEKIRQTKLLPQTDNPATGGKGNSLRAARGFAAVLVGSDGNPPPNCCPSSSVAAAGELMGPLTS